MATPTQRPGNGSALPSEAAANLPGCPLSQSHENRLAEIEARLARFESAMMGAAKMIVDNPMMSAMLPKEMKAAIRQAVDEHEEKTAKEKS